MRKPGLILLFSFMTAGLYAQQLKLLEAEIKEAAKPAAADGGGMPRVIVPREDAPTKAPAQVKEAAPSKAGFAVGKKHKVSGGDTLWDLSGKYYNDPFKWGKIYNANLDTVANPDLIYPKGELIIPDVTEEVKPRPGKAPVIGGVDTVKEAGFSSADVEQPIESAEPAAVLPSAAAGVESIPAAPGETLKNFDRDLLSEEMPEQQREWLDGIKIVPDNWREDGEITAGLKDDNDGMEDGFSLAGEIVEILMAGPGMVKPGDYLAVYLKGGDAYDKSGKRLGRELQPAGLAVVVNVEGSVVKARLLDATTAISKGHIVKKK